MTNLLQNLMHMVLVCPKYDSLMIIYEIELRTKIEIICSTLLDIILGVTQGSKLGPLLLNIFFVVFFYCK